MTERIEYLVTRYWSLDVVYRINDLIEANESLTRRVKELEDASKICGAEPPMPVWGATCHLPANHPVSKPHELTSPNDDGTFRWRW